MPDVDKSVEVSCPCYFGTGKVTRAAGLQDCPLCEGWQTVPDEVSRRFLEVAARRFIGGDSGALLDFAGKGHIKQILTTDK